MLEETTYICNECGKPCSISSKCINVFGSYVVVSDCCGCGYREDKCLVVEKVKAPPNGMI